ncbi:FAD binding domain-containing protein, partial [Metarhizium majus ARSEF 297]
MLCGGFGNLFGLYGLGVDNIISLRVVTADGLLRNVTASSDPDLFWGLRGAGPNLGIVTSAVVKTYPATPSDLQAWTGPLIFSPDKLEAVVEAIQDLDIKPEMNVFMYFVSSGPPKNERVVLVVPYLHKGSPTLGRAAFASLYAIKPMADHSAVLPYNKWNAAGDAFCIPGARKPSYGVGFQKMIPSTWHQVWDRYVEFQKKPGAQNSLVLLEAYSLTKAR